MRDKTTEMLEINFYRLKRRLVKEYNNTIGRELDAIFKDKLVSNLQISNSKLYFDIKWHNKNKV